MGFEMAVGGGGGGGGGAAAPGDGGVGVFAATGAVLLRVDSVPA